MLNPAGAVPPVEDTAPDTRNPLIALPLPAGEVVARADTVLVTHLHNDHFDAAARELLPHETPVMCQPADRHALMAHGFTTVTAVADEQALADGVRVYRAGARHSLGRHEAALGAVSGFAATAPGQPTVYLTSDSVWCDEVASAIDRFRPDVVVVNAGAARFLTGGSISMTAEDVIATARYAGGARVIAVHMEALNHCPMRRDELRRHAVAAGLGDQLVVPADGEQVTLSPR